MSLLHDHTKAPLFEAKDQNGKTHSLASYAGSWVLLYFYPKDDTPGCTKEACMIRDSYPDFKKLGITVLGVSADSEKSHKKFEEKYDLPFTLLSDTEHAIGKAYGAWGMKKFMGRTYEGMSRVSYLIDPKGMIAKVYDKVKPEIHAEEVLRYLQDKAK